MTTRLVHVGLGRQGARWAADFLPPHVEDGRLDVVAAVDIDPDRHGVAQEHLDLSPGDCYTGLEAALDDHDADAVANVTPASAHEAVVTAALDRDLDVITEKPLADDLAGAVRIADAAAAADAKVGVTMSHRFDRDKVTFRRELRDGGVGPLDYLVCRFTHDLRTRGDIDERVYDMTEPLLVDGAVHHLDYLAAFAGAPCERVYAETASPEWAEFEGPSQALVTLRFENGVRAQYEGALANAVELNGWRREYVRAECRDATLELDTREVRRYDHDPGAEIWTDRGPPEGETVPPAEGDRWHNTRIVGQFLDWREGGDPMPTAVAANLRSMALVAAAIESADTGDPVDPRALLAETRAQVRGECGSGGQGPTE